MKRISMPGFVRSLALSAAAVLLLSAAPAQRAEAMSLITPGATPVAKTASGGLITEVHGGRGGGGGGGGFHGGGGGFHGGGFHGGFHGGGGWHGGRGGHGGGMHYGGFHHFGGYRFAHFHHRHFFYGGYYPTYYPAYYYHPRCRVIWTHYGPRRVCSWHHWHRWHYRHYYY